MDLAFLHQGLMNASFGTMLLYTLAVTHVTIVAVTGLMLGFS